MKKRDQDLKEIHEKTRKSEKNLKDKKQARKKKKEKREAASLNERLVAPILLIITLLISYLIMLFS